MSWWKVVLQHFARGGAPPNRVVEHTFKVIEKKDSPDSPVIAFIEQWRVETKPKRKDLGNL